MLRIDRQNDEPSRVELSIFDEQNVFSIFQLDQTLLVGLNRLNWFSKNLDEFFLPAEEKLRSIYDFLDQISSFIARRIEQPLAELSNLEIFEFPENPIDLKTFLDEIREKIREKSEKLNFLSRKIESAVLHVIEMFFERTGNSERSFEPKITDIGSNFDVSFSTFDRIWIFQI